MVLSRPESYGTLGLKPQHAKEPGLVAVPEKTFLGQHTWLARCPVSPLPHPHLHFLPHTLAAVGG